MTLQLTSADLTTIANESDQRKINMLRCKQRAKAHRTDASDTESAFNTSATPSPTLLRKQYPLRNRAMKHQFAFSNNQETNTAVSSDSEETDDPQPRLNFQEKRRNKEFLTGTIRSDEDWQNASRSREQNHVAGQSRHERELQSRAIPTTSFFRSNRQAGPTMSNKYTPQNNQQPLNNCTGPNVHITAAITTTNTMASRVSRVLHQTGCNNKH